MKLHLLLVPLLGALALSQILEDDTCQCPQVNCPADDPLTLCRCLNWQERKCSQVCPDYVPTLTSCRPRLSARPTPTPKPSPCVCEEVMCAQDWPGSCLCANTAALRCHDKCGGPQPTLQSCSADATIAREADPDAAPVPEPITEVAEKCTCEQIMCIQMWPDSCWCESAAAQQCYKKCGGKKPKPKNCPPQIIPTLSTQPYPSFPNPTNTHTICGGGRANSQSCDVGEICITDPYTPGCGPACDGLGICVKDQLCGGIAGFECDEVGQVCHDDPRDECDAQHGGADCGGLCVWPHEPLHGSG